MQQLTIDSIVVSSTVLAVEPLSTRAVAPVTALEPAYSAERIERMFRRTLPVPTAWWDGVAHVVFVAFVRAPLIELAIELQHAFPKIPAFSAWRELAACHIEIKLTMIQLLRIVGTAKQKRILQ